MERTVYLLEKFMDYIFDIKADRAERITEALEKFKHLDEEQQNQILKTIEQTQTT